MHPATLKIFGNILHILEGRVVPSMLRPVSQARFRFALGGASFSDAHGIGETLVIEGVPHVSWVHNGKLCNETHLHAQTPFLMGIDRHQSVGALLADAPAQPTSLEAFYGQLAQKYPMGVVVLGSVLMAKLSAIYLKRAPIYHENVNELHETYWSGVEEYANTPVMLFGVVIPPAAKKAFLVDVLQRAFYQNPRDSKILPFDSHTHAALVDEVVKGKEPEELLRGVGKLKVRGVRHVLTQSVVQEGTFALFPLSSVVAE